MDRNNEHAISAKWWWIVKTQQISSWCFGKVVSESKTACEVQSCHWQQHGRDSFQILKVDIVDSKYLVIIL